MQFVQSETSRYDTGTKTLKGRMIALKDFRKEGDREFSIQTDSRKSMGKRIWRAETAFSGVPKFVIKPCVTVREMPEAFRPRWSTHSHARALSLSLCDCNIVSALKGTNCICID